MFKNIDIVIRNFATLVIVCNMLSWIFPFPPIIWRVGLVVLALYVIFVKQERRSSCEKAILSFAVLNLIYFFISFLWQTPPMTLIGNILCALLPFSLFVYLSEKGVMTEKFFSVFSIVALVVAILQYYQARTLALEELMLGDDDDVTNNATVCFLFILPMLYLIKNNWQKWLILLFCLYFLIVGAKRGNILAAVIPIALFVFYSFKDTSRASMKRIVVLIAIVASSIVVYQWFSTNDFLIYRLNQALEGNSSGRNMIYALAWDAWINSDDVIHFLFGRGFDGAFHDNLLMGYRAHNDWLEILLDYGVLGAVLYFVIFLTFGRMIKKTGNYQTKMVMMSAIFIWLFKTAYSMGFTEGNMPLLMISLGTVVGQYKIESQ